MRPRAVPFLFLCDPASLLSGTANTPAGSRSSPGDPARPRLSRDGGCGGRAIHLVDRATYPGIAYLTAANRNVGVYRFTDRWRRSEHVS